MLIDIRALAVARVEVGDDVVGALVDDGPVFEHQRRDLIAAGLAAKLLTVARIGWYLARDEGHPQLGQTLTNTVRMRTPLRLVELIHTSALPAGTRRYDC